MKKYTVEIVETLSKVIEVEANNMSEAQNSVYDLYHAGEIVLDSSDHTTTEFFWEDQK